VDRSLELVERSDGIYRNAVLLDFPPDQTVIVSEVLDSLQGFYKRVIPVDILVPIPEFLARGRPVPEPVIPRKGRGGALTPRPAMTDRRPVPATTPAS